MKVSQMVTRTLRTDPPEAETASHRLMLKAGLIYQVAAGVYSYLPLALRSLRKIEAIIREEIDDAGGQELMMPALQPLELWSRRAGAPLSATTFSLSKTAGAAPWCWPPPTKRSLPTSSRPTCKATGTCRFSCTRYKRSSGTNHGRGPGWFGVREFDMKDAYSFNADDQSLDATYQDMAQAYRNIFRRCGLPVLMAEADSGAIGGKDSHEFLLSTPTGEDTVISCPDCRYTANAEKAESGRPM